MMKMATQFTLKVYNLKSPVFILSFIPDLQSEFYCQSTGSPALVVRSYYFLIFMRTFRDIDTAVIYCYITTKFYYAKLDSGLSAFRGVMLQWFEFTKVCMGKNINRHFSLNFDVFAIKMSYLNALSFLLSSCFSVQSEAFKASSLFEFPDSKYWKARECVYLSANRFPGK